METIYDREWAAEAKARAERDLWGDDDRAPRVVVVAVEGGWVVRTVRRETPETPVEQRYHERNRLRRDQREQAEHDEEERTAIRGGYPDAGDGVD